MRKLSYLIIACLCLCSSVFPLMARQVTAFNTGWQFKKGPFAADPMRAASQWDGKGGYSAFACEIGTVLQFGTENEIVVKADNKARPDVIPVNQNLFGVYGGIYRPVWLIVTEQNNITVTDCASPGVYITQKNVSKKSADITVKVKLDNARLQPAALTLENAIYTQDGRKVSVHSQSFDLTPQGTQTYTSTFKMKDPHLWHGRKDPYLYKVVCKLMADGKVIDEVVQPLGVRKYEIVAGKGFFLNGEKYPMYGVTRHQDWWMWGLLLSVLPTTNSQIISTPVVIHWD